MKFRLKQGCHREGKSKYVVGDIIETDKDLAQKFGKDRFELVDESVSIKPKVGVEKKELEKLIDPKYPEIVALDNGYYNLVNPKTGEVINDHPLMAQEAEHLRLAMGLGEEEERKEVEKKQEPKEKQEEKTAPKVKRRRRSK